MAIGSPRQASANAENGAEERDFRRLRQEVFARYRAGDHAGALSAARAAAARFPERDAATTYWVACLEAQSGQHAHAVRTLREALDRGLWWSAAWLQGERDFAPLRARADFQATVAEHDRRREAAEAEARPEVVIIPPVDRTAAASADTPPPLVLALHMRNGSARDSAPYWPPPAASGAVVALAQSSQLVSAAGHCWDDEARTRDDVAWALSEARRQYAVDSVRLVLAGASQGGKRAVELALSGEPVGVRGFIAVVPSITKPAPLLPLAAAAAARGLRGWILTGEHDGCRPGVESLHESLAAAGLPCVLEVVQGLGHDFPADFGERLPAALEHVLGPQGPRSAP